MFDYLLPNVFKKLGLGLYILSVFFVLFATDLGIDKIQRNDLISIFAALGFGLIINSKEKIEDERTVVCRYKALGKSFRLVLIMFILIKCLDLASPGEPTSLGFFAFLAVLDYLISFNTLLKNEI